MTRTIKERAIREAWDSSPRGALEDFIIAEWDYLKAIVEAPTEPHPEPLTPLPTIAERALTATDDLTSAILDLTREVSTLKDETQRLWATWAKGR